MPPPSLPSRGSYTGSLGKQRTGSLGGFGISTLLTPASVPTARLEVLARDREVMKAIENVANNSPEWDAFVTKLCGQISSSIAKIAVAKIKRVLRNSSDAASVIARNIDPISELTQNLRNRNTQSTAALREYGTALGHTKITIQRDGTASVDFGPRTKEMFYLEKGYTLTATGRFLAYANAQMNKWLQLAQVQRSELYGYGGGLSGYALKKAHTWLILASLKEGHTYKVPARPVVSPAVEAAKKEFLEQAGTAKHLVQSIGDAFFRGKYHVKIGGDSIGGV